MTWWMYALGAALIWGVHYNILGKAMTTITPLTAYWLPTVIMTVGLPFFYKTLAEDFHKTLAAPLDVKISVVLISFTSFLASIFLYKAIQEHNPVHASLIEVTFPIFVAIFALILFNENHFDWKTTLGGILILLGSMLVIQQNG